MHTFCLFKQQEESARRHEENIEQIRQKAFELSVRKCSSNNDDAPHHQPYDTKKICSLCNVLVSVLLNQINELMHCSCAQSG